MYYDLRALLKQFVGTCFILSGKCGSVKVNTSSVDGPTSANYFALQPFFRFWDFFFVVMTFKRPVSWHRGQAADSLNMLHSVKNHNKRQDTPNHTLLHTRTRPSSGTLGSASFSMVCSRLCITNSFCPGVTGPVRPVGLATLTRLSASHQNSRPLPRQAANQERL